MRLLLLFIILTSSSLHSQVFNREIKFLASEKNKLDKNFTNSIYKEDNPCMSYFERIEIIHDFFEVKISEKELVLIDEHNLECDIPNELKFEYNLSQLEKKNYASVEIFPYIMRNGNTFFLKSFQINIIPKQNLKNKSRTEYKSNSVLSSGTWYKLGVQEDGFYKIDKLFLESIGIDIQSVNPKNIKIYGRPAGMLPEENYVFRIDDLEQLAIKFVGDDDNVFEEDEQILFFGQNPNIWSYDTESNHYMHSQNIYSNYTHYFLTINNNPTKNIQIQSISNTEILSFPIEKQNYVSSFVDYNFHESENYNLVSTGQQWFGEYFGSNSLYSFDLAEGEILDSISFRARVAARSSINTEFDFKFNNQTTFFTLDVPPETSDDYYFEDSEGSVIIDLNTQFSIEDWNGEVIVNYRNNGNPSALAWLDYLEINYKRSLKWANFQNQLIFRDKKFDGGITIFNIPDDTEYVFNVTDPLNVKQHNLNSSVNDPLDLQFAVNIDTLSQFICLKNIENLETPQFFAQVMNQNLHNFSQADLVIVSHPEFLNQAERLGNFHFKMNGTNVIVVTTEQIYNEFSSGSQDPVAIRDFVRMLYNKNSVKNLLLFGDASFDFKNIKSPNTNFVPTFQSYRSDNIKLSYCSDDFFGMLDVLEGSSSTLVDDLIDIGIGRLTVTTNQEASDVVDKIINYATNSYGDWKNKVCFVSDDVDQGWEENLLIHSDALAVKVDTNYAWVNVDKIYSDAFQQESTAGGERYPDVNKKIVELINSGVLIINYVGHGGEVGWASERILGLSEINNFENFDKLPVFVTATCEFSRFDDPERVSAGELLLLNSRGGAISLFSTSRTVNESSAYYITNSLYNYILDSSTNNTMGEIMKKAKNDPSLGNTVNKRKFALIGDPALKIPYPKYNILTNNIYVIDETSKENNFIPADTINALSKVKITGQIEGELTDGKLFVTVFGKSNNFQTLNNNGFLETPFEFDLQKNIIYKGKVDVEKSNFEYEFIVPKDNPFQYGFSKLSYYAHDESMSIDASGSYEDLIIGGINSNASYDDIGPSIELFMNDTNFVSGGLTNSSPELIAKVFDNSGINTVGTGIGHDIVAIIDNLTNQPYILNNYYEADLNTFQSGTVRYSLANLSDGVHVLNLKVWDVYNNSNEKDLSFVVSESEEMTLNYLLNYPNPFSNFTKFSFEHNRPNEYLDVMIQIFTVSGKLVKTLKANIINSGFRDETISWDGLDDYGDKLGRGVYVYKILVKSSESGEKVEKFEKLVILN
tara:strand:+ start:9045 stop:12836 length:3792 start_codon:yes stop_codon:yes gene_type:complete